LQKWLHAWPPRCHPLAQYVITQKNFLARDLIEQGTCDIERGQHPWALHRHRVPATTAAIDGDRNSTRIKASAGSNRCIPTKSVESCRGLHIPFVPISYTKYAVVNAAAAAGSQHQIADAEAHEDEDHYDECENFHGGDSKHLRESHRLAIRAGSRQETVGCEAGFRGTRKRGVS
jgi:hypothetical protein